jgi:hypothetical protein
MANWQSECCVDPLSSHAVLETTPLRALATLEMFAPTPDGRFRNTPLTEMLRSDHPQSQRDGALLLPAAFL